MENTNLLSLIIITNNDLRARKLNKPQRYSNISFVYRCPTVSYSGYLSYEVDRNRSNERTLESPVAPTRRIP